MGPVETNNNLEYARLFDDLAVCEINLLILVCHREIKKQVYLATCDISFVVYIKQIRSGTSSSNFMSGTHLNTYSVYTIMKSMESLWI